MSAPIKTAALRPVFSANSFTEIISGISTLPFFTSPPSILTRSFFFTFPSFSLFRLFVCADFSQSLPPVLPPQFFHPPPPRSSCSFRQFHPSPVWQPHPQSPHCPQIQAPKEPFSSHFP